MKPDKINVIFKPTHECNLACRYCYLDKNAENGRMDTKTLTNVFTKISTFFERTHFIWHGGEPILMGVDFFTEGAYIQYWNKKKNGHEVSNSIQTNGTLIDNEFLDFFEQFKFSVGLSLDGPKDLNDRTRIYKDGRSCFDEIMVAIKRIKEANLGGGVIAILTKENIKDIKKIYQFFRENKINVKVNPLVKSGRATENYETLGISSREYGEAMTNLFDCWFYDYESPISIDPLEEIIGNIMTNRPQECSFSESCQNNFISVGPQGDVYPCGRFDGMREFKLGNINKNSIEEILDSQIRKELLKRRAEEMQGCKTCDYIKICHSGCLHNSYMKRGSISDKDYYCSAYKMIFKHVKEDLSRELRKSRIF